MEKLLEMTKKVCNKAEIYSTGYTRQIVSFKGGVFHDIDTTFLSGKSLRIIKDGKLGFAYTRNLVNRDEFLQNALSSLTGGVATNLDFPLTKELPRLETSRPSLDNLSNQILVDECTRVSDILKSKTDGEISKMGAFTHIENIRIINTAGTDISVKCGEYGMWVYLTYPGTGLGIWRLFRNKEFAETPDNLINEIIELYKISSKTVEPKGGRMKVMFMPNSMVTLNWRIISGTSMKSIFEKISPVADKLEEKIFDERITISDDPLNDKYPGVRPFDDEGVACKQLTIIENGVLKSFFNDLNYASKLNAEPTGHGYRTTQWGGDPIILKPIPALAHLNIKPGNKSFSELVKSIDRGIIMDSALGYHSGNIPNGDYSVGVCPGLYVEKGEIIGRVKDAMVAGNVYETLKQVVDIGDTLYPFMSGAWVPAILFDNISVTAKN